MEDLLTPMERAMRDMDKESFMESDNSFVTDTREYLAHLAKLLAPYNKI